MKLLLIDDHPIVRAGCVRVLQQRADVEITEAETAAAGLAAAQAHCPDIVILDLNLPDRRGLDLLSDLKAACPAAKVIVFSMYEDPAFVATAMQGGAQGYVTKNDDPDALLEAIDEVMGGGFHQSKIIEARMAEAKPGLQAELTERERRLLALLAEGKVLGEVAGALGVSYRTTAEDAARLRIRLGLRSNAALIKYAVERQVR